MLNIVPPLIILGTHSRFIWLYTSHDLFTPTSLWSQGCRALLHRHQLLLALFVRMDPRARRASKRAQATLGDQPADGRRGVVPADFRRRGRLARQVVY